MLTPQEAIQNIKNNKISQVYHLHGEEDYLVSEILKLLRDKIVDPSMADFNYTDVSSKDISINELVNSCNTLPMFSDKRFIVCRDSELIKEKDADVLLVYLDNPSESTVLALVGSGEFKSRKLNAKLQEKYAQVKAKKIYENEIPFYLKTIARKYGKDISQKAIQYFTFFSGESLFEIDSEIQKVATYIGDKKEIDEKDFEAVLFTTRKDSIFKLMDSFSAKDVKNSIIVLTRLIDSGEPEILIFNMLAKQIKTMLQAKVLAGEKKERGAISKELGIPYFKEATFFNSLKNFTIEELKRIHQSLVSTDYNIKYSKLDKKITLEKFILDVCGPRY